MTIREVITELEKYEKIRKEQGVSEGIVELQDTIANAGSDETGTWFEDGPCESVREIEAGVILSSF